MIGRHGNYRDLKMSCLPMTTMMMKKRKMTKEAKSHGAPRTLVLLVVGTCGCAMMAKYVGFSICIK